MSDFNSSFYTPPYIPPSYFLPPPTPPMITPENPGAANAYYQQQQQQIANSGGAGYVPFNPATSPNTAPSGMTYPGAGMVQPYPSFGEAGNYGRLPDDSYQPEQAFSPSGGAGGYTPQSLQQYNSNPYRGDDWTMPNADASTFWGQQAPTNYVPEQSWGGYTPADDFSTRFPVNQSQSPPWQPLPSVFDTGTSPTPYFNDFLVPQYSQSFQQYLSNPFRGDDWTGGIVSGGGGAASAAAATNQGDVYGGGAASAAPSYNPFNQYGNGGYDPFSAQTYQPAAQQNVGTGGYSAQSMAQYLSNPNRGDDWMPDRAYPPQLPDVIGNGGYPTLDQRWEPLYEPYNNAPLNNALFDRSMQLAPETGIPADWGGGGGRSPSGAPPRGSAEWYGGGWDQIPDAGYNPIQQYQNSGYDPFVSSYENDANQILQQIDQTPPQSYAPPDTLQPGDYGAMPARGSADWYGGGWDQIPEASLNAMNATRDAAARALMAQQKPPADLGGATVTPSPDFTSNNPTLAEQRAPFAETIRNDPAKALQLAARLYSEDQNNADSRVGILEAMLNRYNATGQDPFNPTYYPTDTKQYTDALNKLSSDNALLNQVYQEMERAWGGSNVSNYATDWGSGSVAETGRTLGTPTWISPTSEQFYRKDINNDWAGSGIAKQNQDWYLRSSTTNR